MSCPSDKSGGSPPLGRAVHLFLIAILGIALYGNSLKGNFLSDDDYLVKQNSLIMKWSGIPHLFTKDIAAGGGERWNSYRPLQMLTYAMDYSLWGFNPVGYHLTNLMLHILAALSVYFLANSLFADPLLSLTASLLFLAHPVHTEAVAFISGRADSLAAIFTLLAFVLYVKNAQSPEPLRTVLCACMYALALLSRENALILPAILLLYHWIFRQRLRIGQFLPLLALALVYLAIRLTILKPLLSNLVYSTTLAQRAPGFPVAMLHYLRLLLVPLDLHMHYGNPTFTFTDPGAIAGMALIVLLMIIGWATRGWNRLLSFSAFWFLITLLPQSNLYPINAYMAEHWLYLPSVGFFIALGAALAALSRRGGLEALACCALVILLVAYTWLTVRQNNYWRDPITYYERTLRHAPDNPTYWNSLGNSLSSTGRRREAIVAYRKALALKPLFPEACNNLGVELKDAGEREEAITLLKEAIALKPRYAEAVSNLGLVYGDAGMKEEAAALFRKAMELDPAYGEAYNNLAIEYVRAGRKEEAAALLRRAIELNPAHESAYLNLGLVYKDIGKECEAMDLFRRALRINPNSVDACYSLGRLCSASGEGDEAVVWFTRAIELDPSHEATLNCLAVEYISMRRTREAEAMLMRVIRAHPRCAQAYNNLGFIYKDAGRRDEAIGLLKKAIELNPHCVQAYNNLGVAYRDAGKGNEAMALFRKTVELDPNNPDGHYNLAASYSQKKKYRLAITHCDRAIELGYRADPEFLKLLEQYRR